MPYSNSFSRRNPGFLVIMIDQSGSMCSTSQNNGLELAENAANSVNNLINELILKLGTVDANGNEIVKRSIKICLIGYGGPNDEAYCILKDSEHPDGCMWIDEIDEKFPMGKVKVATREGLFAQDCIEVVKPVAEGIPNISNAFVINIPSLGQQYEYLPHFVLSSSISIAADIPPVK